MAASSGIFLWITVSGTGEVVEKTAEEATSLLLQGTFGPGMSARLAGDQRTATLSMLLEWLDFVHGTRLQLTGRIDTESVRASFRKLSRQYHPDHTETLGPDLQALAERRFKEINESKSYLLARLDSGLDSLVIGADVAEPRIPPPAVSPSLAPSPAANSRDRGFRDDGKKQRTTTAPRQARGKLRRGYLGPLAGVIGLVALFLWIGHLLRTGPTPPVVESDTAVSSPPSTEPPPRVVDYGELAKTSPANRPPDDESTPAEKPSATETVPTETAPNSGSETGKPKPAAAVVGPADPSNELKGAPTPVAAGAAIDPAVDTEVAAILAEYERSSQEAAGQSFAGKLGLLNNQHRTALKRAEAEAVSKGESEAVMAIREEEESVRTTGDVRPGADLAKLPEAVRILRQTYVTERTKLEEARERGLAEPRQVAIAKLEKRLESAMREGAQELALTIRAAISNLDSALNRSGSGASEHPTPPGFSLIPGGSFAMGRTSGDTDSNAPPITVTVSPFYIQQTEATKAQWDEVRTWGRRNGYTDLADGDGKASNHPVHSVSWYEVVKWCNARSEKEGLTPVYTMGGAVMRTGTREPMANWGANGYRLPTEAEWEKAARGGVSGKRFPWGTDTISHAQANFRNNGGEAYATGAMDHHPSYTSGRTPFTSPVGNFAANGYGVYNMAGNVWEWCWDWYGSRNYTTSNGTTDPRGGTSGSVRVLRGGSWNDHAVGACCAIRGYYTPGYASYYNGFRPARSAILDAVPARKVTPNATPNATPDAVPARSATPNTMVQIPGGSFTMGRTSGDTDADAPPITVTVSPFYIQQTETTKAQWDEVRTWALSKGYTDLGAGRGKASNHPVQAVGWWDVVKWCNARSEKEGLTPVYSVSGAVMRTGTTEPTANWSANGYRLPTEAEWEKAARGGVSGKRFPWGTDTISHAQANFRNNGSEAYATGTTDHHPSYTAGEVPYTSPVGIFGVNAYGLSDMAGNVFEWCWDWYGNYATSNGTTDPRGPGSGTVRVYRSGSWGHRAIDVRCARRRCGSPGYSNSANIGFRPARSAILDAIPARKVTPNSIPDAIPARSATPSSMVQIPGGSFTMGRTSGDTDADAPPITVTVSPFYLQKTETTKAQWDEVRTWGRRNGYTDLVDGDGKASNHPVHSVSWYEVVKWCNARSEKEGLTPVYTMGGAVMRTGTLEPMANWGANGYRLPTEAEWEKAARGGVSGKRYPWGTDEISHAKANYSGSGTSFRNESFGYHPSYTGGGMPYTAPVESFAANGHGLFGMAGNVREWCWDWYGPSYYTTSNGTTDPRGPASGTDRVFRGGGWTGGSLSTRCGYRFYSAPGILGDLSGFRPARSSVP